MLNIVKKSDGILSLAGRFDASQVDTAEEAFNKIRESATLDFSGLDYISSAGLGVLVATQQRLAEAEHNLTLSNMNAHIREVFQISSLDQLFIIK